MKINLIRLGLNELLDDSASLSQARLFQASRVVSTINCNHGSILIQVYQPFNSARGVQRMFRSLALSFQVNARRITPELTGRADNIITAKLTIKATLFALRLNELLGCLVVNIAQG